MNHQLKSFSEALPLIAVIAIALVYIRAWALFRPFDPTWVSALSASDIFSMGWGMAPAIIIPIAVGVGGGVMAKKLSPPTKNTQLDGSRVFNKILAVTSGIFLMLAWLLLATSIGIILPSRMLRVYSVLIYSLVMLHCVAAYLTTRSLASFNRLVLPAIAVTMIAIWDYEGAAGRARPPLKKIALEEGGEMCHAVIFFGQNALFLWDAEEQKAIVLERRLISSVTKQPKCDSAPAPPREPERPQ